jgi:hypothetical protein
MDPTLASLPNKPLSATTDLYRQIQLGRICTPVQYRWLRWDNNNNNKNHVSLGAFHALYSTFGSVRFRSFVRACACVGVGLGPN